MNVEQVLDAVIERVPAPKRLDNESNFVMAGTPNTEVGNTVKALVFDSQYDMYK
jgi:translation elongation factor EF-4